MPLSRDEILGADDLKIERIDLPEWGEGAFAFTRLWDGRGLENYYSHLFKHRDLPVGTPIPDMVAVVVCLSLCDENGVLIFKFPDDVPLIAAKSGWALDRIFDQAWAKNRPASADELEKKSESGPVAASG